jgi:DNA-binding transcriptional LysR family regulator
VIYNAVNMIRLQDIDLNLLIVFEQMLQERQVSAVARNLRLSQPAVGNALIRLRRTLDDPLFVRTSAGMQPTPLAKRLAEPITLALSNITRAINYKERFDPQTSRRHFSIAVSELGEIDLIPTLANKCTSLAPRIQISTVRAGATDLTREMEAGRVDLALGAFEDMSTTLFRRRLFKQSCVTMFRAGHAFGRGEITLKNFLSARHLFVSTADSPYDRVNRSLQRAGIMATVTLQVPHFTAVPYLVRATDCVTTVPERFAEAAAAPFGLEFISPPLRLPSLAINCWWHPRFHQDEGNQWLLALIVQLFAN